MSIAEAGLVLKSLYLLEKFFEVPFSKATTAGLLHNVAIVMHCFTADALDDLEE